jgi:hypothetical protein
VSGVSGGGFGGVGVARLRQRRIATSAPPLCFVSFRFVVMRFDETDERTNERTVIKRAFLFSLLFPVWSSRRRLNVFRLNSSLLAEKATDVSSLAPLARSLARRPPVATPPLAARRRHAHRISSRALEMDSLSAARSGLNRRF